MQGDARGEFARASNAWCSNANCSYRTRNREITSGDRIILEWTCEILKGETDLRETFPYLRVDSFCFAFDRSADMRLFSDNIMSDIKFRREFSSARRANPKRLNPYITIYLQCLEIGPLFFVRRVE